jgi:lysozyme
MKRKIVILLATLSLLIAAAIPGSAAQAWGNCAQSYIVRPGDTLASIARTFGTSWTYLASINGLSNPNFIWWGQTLCVSVYTPPPPPPQNRTYVVQRGDWLSLIARRFGVSLWSLLQVNPLMNPNLIYPGQVLNIPTY